MCNTPDDVEIVDDAEVLHRAILYKKWLDAEGKPTYMAFRRRMRKDLSCEPYLSLDRANQRKVGDTVKSFKDCFAVSSLVAKDVRSISYEDSNNLKINLDVRPFPLSTNQAHCGIENVPHPELSTKESERIGRILARNSKKVWTLAEDGLAALD